jgi:hypothetical protein
MDTAIRPALTPDEWKNRRAGSVAIDAVDDDVHLVVRDPDDEIVSVSGNDELWALIALANAALSDGDPRKFTPADVAVARIVGEAVRRDEPGAAQLLALADLLQGKLAALLPPPR